MQISNKLKSTGEDQCLPCCLIFEEEMYTFWAVSQAQNRLCRLRDGASGVKKALLPSCDGVDF